MTNRADNHSFQWELNRKMEKIFIINSEIDKRSPLYSIVKSEGYEAVSAGHCRASFNKLRDISPSVVLVDMKQCGKKGLKIIKKIRELDNAVPVIMLTSDGNIKDAVQAIKFGAYNYLTRPVEDRKIIANIKSALKTRISADILSSREREVLRWLKVGKSSWEISQILDITERTINYHVNKIFTKLNAVSRAQAVAIALENGLID